MIWARRSAFPHDGYHAVQLRFQALFLRLSGPKGMIFAVHERGARADVYLSVPDMGYLAAFPGFQVIDENDIPAFSIAAACGHAEDVERFHQRSATVANG